MTSPILMGTLQLSLRENGKALLSLVKLLTLFPCYGRIRVRVVQITNSSTNSSKKGEGMSRPSRSWQFILYEMLRIPGERQRLATALGINPLTLHRWAKED